LACGAAQAQTVPDAGSLGSQNERNRQPALPPQAAPLLSAPPPALSVAPGTRIAVRAFAFAGSYVFTPSGLSSSNYDISYSNANLTIQQRALTLAFAGIGKTYDGTTLATVSATDDRIAGDTLSINRSASFASKNAGTGVAVLVSGVGLDGLDALNYSLPSTTANTSANIDQAALSVTAPTVSRAYDGTLQAAGTASVGTLAGAAAGDRVATAATLAFTDKNAGAANKTVRASGLTLTDANNQDVTGNYAISYADNTQSTITPKAVALTASGVGKVYDGNTAFALSGAALQALSQQLGVAGDTVLAAGGAFDNKNVGTGKSANLSSATLNDGNGGANYELSFSATADNSISRLNSVVWTGPAQGGNWFDPANWAGSAVPDLGNVANVTIPGGVIVDFGSAVIAPAERGVVQIDSLGSAGSLAQIDGDLQVGSGGVQLSGFTQTGGSTSVAGMSERTRSNEPASNPLVEVSGDGVPSRTAK